MHKKPEPQVDPLVGLRQLSVAEIMSPHVLTVGEGWTLRELCNFLMDNHISGAPVVSREGEMVGVVSETDIVRYDSTEEYVPEPEYLHDYYMHSLERRVTPEGLGGFHLDDTNTTLVRDIMTPMVFQVPEATLVQQAAAEMVRGRIHRLFISRGKETVGVVSALDLVRILADL
jgi:CBS domain-containing protein